ncbi:hypothetical protein BB558_002547 [Smittium angustum]|uniref:Peptidase S1 domain-containing protein n=1 Tax=Smittium angustum TaxID=133377 RepID=A0A2U1J8P5_SMIAN|nr:hypothetical protein BB558_002547 [Smittium angustum]
MKSVLSLFLLFSVPQAVLTYGINIPKTNSTEQLSKNTERLNKSGSNNRIVNGAEVKISEYSSVASILTRGKINEYCTGTFISKDVVLTAAHCVYNKTTGLALPKDITVGGGTEMIVSKIKNKYTVQKLLVHPSYNQSTTLNDVALLFLKNPPAKPLYTFAKIYNIPITDDTPVEAAGWGRTNEEGDSKTPDHLSAVPLFISSSQTCSKSFKYWKSNNGSKVCTVNRNSKGICFGDSGGPLYYTGDSSKPIVGITNSVRFSDDNKKKCGVNGKPAYFANAQYYIGWILNNTQIDAKDLLYKTSSPETKPKPSNNSDSKINPKPSNKSDSKINPKPSNKPDSKANPKPSTTSTPTEKSPSAINSHIQPQQTNVFSTMPDSKGSRHSSKLLDTDSKQKTIKILWGV